ERSAHNVKRVRFGLERLEGGRNILCPPDFKRREFDPERASAGLNLGQLQHSLGKANINDDCQPAETGDNFVQELEPLAGQIRRLERESSDVASRSCQTCYQAAADRVARQRKYDGDDRCRPLYYWHRGSVRENGVNFQADKLGRELRIALGTIRPAILDRDGATLDPAERAQSLHKSSNPWIEYHRSVREQEPDRRQLSGLQRTRRERPRRRAAEQRDKLAAPHSSALVLPVNLRLAPLSSEILARFQWVGPFLPFVGSR